MIPGQRGEAQDYVGFSDTHTGVLPNPEAIEHIRPAIGEATSISPEDHLRVLFTGGFTVPVGSRYAPIEAYCLLN